MSPPDAGGVSGQPPGPENASPSAACEQEVPSWFGPGYRWRKYGFSMEVVERVGDVVLTRLGWQGKDIGWEVAVIQRHRGYSVGGVVVPPGEFYPSPEQWGGKGWSYPDEAGARARFVRVTGGGA